MKKNEDTADFIEVIVRTIENIRRRFVEDGYGVVLYGTPREIKLKHLYQKLSN